MAAEEKKEKSKDHAPEKDAKDKKVEKTAVAAPEDEAKAAKKKRLIIMIAGGVLVVAGGAVAAIMLLGGGGSKDAGDGHGAPAAEHGAAEGHGEAAKAESGGHGEKAADKGKGEHGKTEGGHGESAKKDEHGSKEGHDKKDEHGKPAAENKEASKSGDLEGVDFGQTQPLKPFHLNLGNPLENRYVRLELSFEYKGGDAQKAEIEKRMPQLRDAIGNIASRKSREFLLGPDGKDQLRHEILIRVNQFMNRPIESVFITDMLIE